MRVSLTLALVLLAGCGAGPWNDPWPRAEGGANVLYSSFQERPKHLDPARSYSSNEYAFLAQIYEPPLQYHFLLRPYRLVPLTADVIPEPAYYDAEGRRLPGDAPTEAIAWTDYVIRIRPGIRFQPHPALARDDAGAYRYHALTAADLAGINRLADFPATGTRELTAADYVYQIKRLATPWRHSPIAGLLSEHIDDFQELTDRIEARAPPAGPGGERPFLDLDPIPFAGAQVLDRYVYRIRVKGKYPQFPYWLAMPFFAPMPWEADRFYDQPGMKARNLTLDWYPLGTGPYYLSENNPNLRMVLTRNPHFHGELYPAKGMPEDAARGLLRDAGRPLPFIDRAVYALEKESIPYWNKFLQGWYDSSGIASDAFDQAIRFDAQGGAGLTPAMAEKGIGLLTAVETSIFYLGFNMRDPVVGGDSERARLLRRAIAIAVDYEEYIAIFTNGRALAAQGPLPPGIFGYREGEAGINPYVYRWERDGAGGDPGQPAAPPSGSEAEGAKAPALGEGGESRSEGEGARTSPSAAASGQAVRRGLDEARALLGQAGYPGGRDPATGQALTLYYEAVASGPDDKANLAWLRKQFAKLGIELIVRATDYNRFQEKMRQGTGQLFNWGWHADYPDPENFLFLLYGPNGKVTGEGENAANYANPEFDRRFERMRNLDDGPERQALIDEMVEIVRQDGPWVWGYYPKAFSLHHAWLSNLKPNDMANNTLKYRRLDPELRQRLRQTWNQPVLWPLWLGAGVLVLAVLPAIL
ncbi:MAG: ABC transporter substrate-binding protein, partial [Chromatiaceae bacterium]|nr:ABC transporter substrate-binding protein [Candidatus Thioaporhodococcus sediminis]